MPAAPDHATANEPVPDAVNGRSVARAAVDLPTTATPEPVIAGTWAEEEAVVKLWPTPTATRASIPATPEAAFFWMREPVADSLANDAEPVAISC